MAYGRCRDSLHEMSVTPTEIPAEVEQARGPRGPAPVLAGATDGNERLTVQAGAVLFVLLAALGITIVRIGQLTWLHLFIGLLLIGPLALKLASTGYRFARYYTHDPAYVRKGPPLPLLRMMAPLLVIDTLVVFASGVALLLAGPSSRDTLMPVHKVSFILWLGLTGLHVLGHLGEVGRNLVARRETRAGVLAAAGADTGSRRPARRRPAVGAWVPAPRLPGSSGRALALALALLGGLVLAIALIPDFAPWVGRAAQGG